MIKKYGVFLSFSLILALQATAEVSSVAQSILSPIKNTATNPIEDINEEVLNKISTIINEQLSHINLIIARIDNLSIESSIKKQNTTVLLDLQNKLLNAKNNFDHYANNKEHLVGLLELLTIVSKKIEEGLKESFTNPLSFNSEKTSRSYGQSLKKATKNSINKVVSTLTTTTSTIGNGLSKVNQTLNPFAKKAKPDQLEKLIKETQSHLVQSEKLIQNLGKTWVNRAYAKFTGWLNTPLFTIAPLGNIPVYPGAIAKRIAIYGGNTVLLMYNLNQNIVDLIPFTQLRDGVTKIKNVFGNHNPKGEVITMSVDKVETDEDTYYIGMHRTTAEIQHEKSLEMADSTTPLKKDPVTHKVLMGSTTVNGGTFPCVYSAITGNPIIDPRLTNDGIKSRQKFLNQLLNDPAYLLRTALSKVLATFNLISAAAIFFENPTCLGKTLPEELLESIGHIGKCYDLTEKKGLPYYILERRDPLTGKIEYFEGRNVDSALHKIYNPSDEFLQKLPTCKQVTPYKFLPSTMVDKDGNAISPNLVFTQTGYAHGQLKQNRTLTSDLGNKLIDQVMASIGWLVEPDIKTVFTLPVNTWLASFIYEDLKFLRGQINNVGHWVHGKLSGAKAKVEDIFLTSNITFQNVVGRDAIKEKLMPYIKFVENPSLALQAGINVPRGIIFAGEPQTGKTMMAKAFLGELSQAVQKQGSGRLFRMIKADVHVLMKEGLGAYINYMKQYAPCIVFCDEFELTGAQRNENKPLLAEFLTAISGFESSQDIDKMVFFLVATNHPENIDHALQEPGRLGTHIYFETPGATDRYEFFMNVFNKAHIDTKSLDIEGLVQETAACSYGRLEEICGGILTKAENRKETVSQKHIDETLDEMVRRIVIDEYDIPTEQKLALASRYGAQAFTSLVLNPKKKFVGATIYKITPKFTDKIVAKNYALLANNPNYTVENKKVLFEDDKPSMIYGGFFSYNTDDTFGLISNEEKVKLCKIALAGSVGQEVLGLPYYSFDSDMLLAEKYLREIVLNGLSKQDFTDKDFQEKLTEITRLREQYKQEVKQLLLAHKEEYRKIVDLLQRRYIIRTSDIKECFGLTSLDLTSYFTKFSK